MEKPQRSNKQQDRNWLTYSGMAFEMFGITAVFTALGYFLDKQLYTSPIFILVMLFIGLAGAMYRIYKQFS